MPKKKKASEPALESEFRFEQSLVKLQEIVQVLEQGNLPLAKSLEAYETGVALLKVCYGQLEHAEQRIRMVTGVDSDGQISLSDFDASATIDQLHSGRGTRRTDSATSEDDKEDRNGEDRKGEDRNGSYQDDEDDEEEFEDNENDDETDGEPDGPWKDRRLF